MDDGWLFCTVTSTESIMTRTQKIARLVMSDWLTWKYLCIVVNISTWMQIIKTSQMIKMEAQLYIWDINVHFIADSKNSNIYTPTKGILQIEEIMSQYYTWCKVYVTVRVSPWVCWWDYLNYHYIQACQPLKLCPLLLSTYKENRFYIC